MQHLELALHAGDLLLQAGGGGLRIPGASCSLLRLRRRPLRLGHRLSGRNWKGLNSDLEWAHVYCVTADAIL
jgi:hypothetical protein